MFLLIGVHQTVLELHGVSRTNELSSGPASLNWVMFPSSKQRCPTYPLQDPYLYRKPTDVDRMFPDYRSSPLSPYYPYYPFWDQGVVTTKKATIAVFSTFWEVRAAVQASSWLRPARRHGCGPLVVGSSSVTLQTHNLPQQQSVLLLAW